MSSPQATPRSDWQAFKADLASGDEAAPYVVHRLVGYPFFLAAIKVGIKANYVSLLSLAFSLVAAGLFLSDIYLWKIVAVAFLNLGLAVDTIDGPVARRRGEASEFGAWLSAFGMTFKTIAIWSCIAIGAYLEKDEPIALMLGIVALGHFFMSYHLMRTNLTYSFYQYAQGAVGISRTRRMGLEASWVLLISAFALSNQLYLLLIVFAGVGALPWAILTLRAVQSYLNSDS